MRINYFIAILLFCSNQLIGQSVQLSARIDQHCNSVPDQLNIPSTQKASQFKIISIKAGQNCYNGSPFKEKGFVIKNSYGDLVFRYSINEKGEVDEPNGKLKDLKLGAGIYEIYVDGGNGAILELNCYLL